MKSDSLDSFPRRVSGGHLMVSSSRLTPKSSFEFYASEFGAPYDLTRPVELLGLSPSHGCEPFQGVPEFGLRGKALLIDRGKCTFSEKLQNAYLAGASLVVFGNGLLQPMILPGSVSTALQPFAAGFMNGTLISSMMIYHEVFGLNQFIR